MNPRRRTRCRTQKRCEKLLAAHYKNTPRGTRRSLEQAQTLIQRVLHAQGNGRFMTQIGWAAFASEPVLR